MFDLELLTEANRQFTVCNACRYCEGICSVFPAMELRTAFAEGDVAYLSTLCHDCRACVHACPFSPPHEFAIDIPALMSAARAETFEHYARPRAFWRILARASTVGGLIVAAAAFFTLVALTTGSSHRLIERHSGSGAFYAILTYAWVLVPALVASVATMAAILAGAWGFARETDGGAARLLNRRAIVSATRNALALTNLKGGGGGCRYPGDQRSSVRRYFHHAVFYGYGAMFGATVAAGVEQDLMGRRPPYPFFSVPVLLGTAGGISAVIGCTGFIAVGIRTRGGGKSSESHRLDSLFTATLLAATVSGLLLLALRSTTLLAAALILHLGTLGGLYLTFPYSKFVHWVYRYLALIRSHVERSATSVREHDEVPTLEILAETQLQDA